MVRHLSGGLQAARLIMHAVPVRRWKTFGNAPLNNAAGNAIADTIEAHIAEKGADTKLIFESLIHHRCGHHLVLGTRILSNSHLIFSGSLRTHPLVAASSKEALVRGDEDQLIDARRRRDEAIGGVDVLHLDLVGLECDLVIERCFTDTACCHRITNPLARIGVELEAPPFDEQARLPNRDRREPKLCISRYKKTSRFLSQPAGIEQRPEPHVGVEQVVPVQRSASQSP